MFSRAEHNLDCVGNVVGSIHREGNDMYVLSYQLPWYPGCPLKPKAMCPCPFNPTTFAADFSQCFRQGVPQEGPSTHLNVSLRECDHLGENVCHLQVLQLIPFARALPKP